MELILKRIAKKKGYTVGRLFRTLSPEPSPLKGEGEGNSQLSTLRSATTGDACVEQRSKNEEFLNESSVPRAERRMKNEELIADSQDANDSTPLPTREGLGESLYLCDTLEPQWRDYKNGGRKIPGCPCYGTCRNSAEYASMPATSRRTRKGASWWVRTSKSVDSSIPASGCNA